MIIYSFATRPDFLLGQLFPKARVLNASPFEDGIHIPMHNDNPADGDLDEIGIWLFHLNISRSDKWFRDRQSVLSRIQVAGYRIVNGGITDILKTTIQQHNCQLGLPTVTMLDDDEPDTQVIVKTNYNYGAVGESWLNRSQLEALGLVDISTCSVKAFDEYYCCRFEEVDYSVRADSRLVVERYVENPEGKFYRFYRCGTRAVLSEIICDRKIKKMRPGLPRKNWYYLFDAPESDSPIVMNAIRFCRAIDLEFGALDLAVDESAVPYIIDVNPTPGWGSETQSDILSFLREGFKT